MLKVKKSLRQTRVREATSGRERSDFYVHKKVAEHRHDLSQISLIFVITDENWLYSLYYTLLDVGIKSECTQMFAKVANNQIVLTISGLLLSRQISLVSLISFSNLKH